jgi:probable phosphoglycerate mutase
MTHLYLIRHGEAMSNITPIIGGAKGDAGLSPLGLQQVDALRGRLAEGEIPAEVLISSTLPRARQTAEAIAPALGLPILWDDEVQELRPGDADGLTLTEMTERYGLPNFEADPYRPFAPGGESWALFLLRVGTALHRIADEHAGKHIVVVCHGGIIDGSMLCFFGASTQTVNYRVEFFTHNTAITHWERVTRTGPGWEMHPGTPTRWRLVGYNDIAHLRAVGARTHAPWSEFREEAATGEERPSIPLPTEPSSPDETPQAHAPA